jgi:protocatechuate 3,4-dioxygenase beta subunit
MPPRIITDVVPNSNRRRLAAALVLLPFSPGVWSQACGPATPRQTEGPFYKPATPQRSSLLEPGERGTKLLVTGRVLSRDCKPVANALLDFWHADGQGAYDNRGFRYRGHQFTDAEGRYRLETIVPAEYPGRARHIHVKLQAPGGRLLTTQLYFPDEPGNSRDGLYRPQLAMQMKERSAGLFDFVVA